jgi:hypothetical protein
VYSTGMRSAGIPYEGMHGAGVSGVVMQKT